MQFIGSITFQYEKQTSASCMNQTCKRHET